MSILTVADATRAARITGTPTADQLTTLGEMINALTPVLERLADCPIELATRTYTGDPNGKWRIVLPSAYNTVTSVVANGATIPTSQYDAVTDASRGVLREAPLAFPPWIYCTTITITYTVGSATIPYNVWRAAMELVAYWWQTSQQGRAAAGSSGAMQWGPPGDVPAVVTSLLAPTRNELGFA